MLQRYLIGSANAAARTTFWILTRIVATIRMINELADDGFLAGVYFVGAGASFGVVVEINYQVVGISTNGNSWLISLACQFGSNQLRCNL